MACEMTPLGWGTMGRTLGCALALAACTPAIVPSAPAPDVGVLPTGPATTIPAVQPYAIRDSHELIGGPQAEGRLGDVLLTNGVIRAIINQPGYYPGVSSFGGALIDIDWVRSGGPEHGRDQFGAMFPLLNVEWTSNAKSIQAYKDFDLDKFLRGELLPLTERDDTIAAPAIVVNGVIDAYDYLDVDFIEPVAHSLAGQKISYDPRFDDMNDPFQSTDLRGLSTIVRTIYEMPKGANYIKITTVLQNNSDAPIKLPVGDFLNASGQLEFLIPGQGFTPPLLQQIVGDAAGIILGGQPGIDISYGYFYDLRQFTDAAGARLSSTSLTYNGVTGILLGESFLTGLFPLGGSQRAQINFAVPAHGTRSITRYFVVGTGSAGSVLDAALPVLHVPSRAVDGFVVDAQNQTVAGATVAVQAPDGQTITVWRTDAQGRFSGLLPSGEQSVLALGRGEYQLKVNKDGYLAGQCTPDRIDIRTAVATKVACRLGFSGLVQFAGPARDAATHQPLTARVTIVGVDPTPDRVRPAVFGDPILFDRAAGVMQVRYLDLRGRLDLDDADSIRLEPGRYTLLFSHGIEYEARQMTIDVPTYGLVRVDPGTLQRVIATPGWVSADFHVHARPSPDSAVPLEQRVIAASGEGLDVLHSSDHDYVADYAPVVAALEARSMIPVGQLGTITGNEITPIHLGHFHAFPLERDDTLPNGGAVHWAHGAGNTDGPSPSVLMSIQETLDAVQAQHAGHELVFQINHISDPVMSLLVLSSLVTSPVYQQIDGLDLLTALSDPLTVRLPTSVGGSAPFAWGTSPHTGSGFTAIELAVGPELTNNRLFETALPQWFNLLNAGLLYTATSNSDTHSATLPVGLPRNYIEYDLDPADGMGGTWKGLNRDAYAQAINQHRVTVSAGPIVQLSATNAAGEQASIGGMISGKQLAVRVDVTAPSWAWFDTIELYANTEPTPLADDGIRMMHGAAEHAHTFFAPYHRPWFVYEPTARFRLRDGTLTNWVEEHGRIHATVEVPLTVPRDAWIVAVARGTAETEGFRTLFPLMPLSHMAEGEQPEVSADAATPLAAMRADSRYAMPAWGFTNPIFVDTDGDVDHDGNPFEALYQQQGISPIGK